jgi:hypothetical protein
MRIDCRCTSCGLHFSLSKIDSGSEVTCPACQGAVEITFGQLPAAPPAPAPIQLQPTLLCPSEANSSAPARPAAPPPLPLSTTTIIVTSIVVLVASIAIYALMRYSAEYIIFPLAIAVIGGLIGWFTVKSALRPMVPAMAVQIGHALWLLLGALLLRKLELAEIDLAIIGAGLIWLWVVPGVAPVLFLLAYQMIGVSINLCDLAVMRTGTVMHQALWAHVVLRLTAIIFLCYGAQRMFLKDWEKRPIAAWMRIVVAISLLVPAATVWLALTMSRHAVKVAPPAAERFYYYGLIALTAACGLVAAGLAILAARRKTLRALVALGFVTCVDTLAVMTIVTSLRVRAPNATFPSDSWLVADESLASVPRTRAPDPPAAPTGPPTPPVATTFHYDRWGSHEPEKPYPVKEGTLRDIGVPPSSSPGSTVVKNRILRDGVTISSLDCMFVKTSLWDPSGTAFFLLHSNSRISRVSVPEFDDCRLELGQEVSGIALSSEGLLVAVRYLQEVWILDPQKLQLRKRVRAPEVVTVLSSPELKFALAVHDSGVDYSNDDSSAVFLDLVAGEPTTQFFLPTAAAQISPNGKCYFAGGPTHELVEFTIEPSERLVPTRSTTGGLQGWPILVSPDSKLVCLGRAVKQQEKLSGTPLFAINDFGKPELTLATGEPAKSVSFSADGSKTYTLDSNDRIQEFETTTAQLKRSIKIEAPNEQFFPIQLFANPAGSKFLLIGNTGAWLVELQ